MFKKTFHIISSVIMVLIFISLIVCEISYKQSNNTWVEKEDASTGIIIVISVVLVVGIIIAAIMIPTIKKVRKITEGKIPQRPNPDAIRKNNASQIVKSALGIFFLLIISENTVFKFALGSLNMDYSQAKYFAGAYQIFDIHFLILSIVRLISAIVTYSTDNQTENDKTDTNESCLSENTYPAIIACPSCGFKQHRDRKVCWKCGIDLESLRSPKCPACQNTITKETVFCAICGTKIPESVLQSADFSDTPVKAPAQLTPKDQAEIRRIYYKGVFAVLGALFGLLAVALIMLWIKL